MGICQPDHTHLLFDVMNLVFVLRGYCKTFPHARILFHYYNFSQDLHLFAIILKRKRNMITLLLLSCRCIVTINVLWLFFTVPWVGLQYVIVLFPDHTHLLFHRGPH